MDVRILPDKPAMGKAAGEHAAALLQQAIRDRGVACLVVATGTSQYEVLATLAGQPEIYWPRVTLFPLDEYAGMPATHPASLRRFLWERFHSRLILPDRKSVV